MPPWLWRLQGLLTPLQFLEQWQAQYGDIFRLPNSEFNVVCVSSPTGLQTVLSAPPEVISANQKGSLFEVALGQHALVFLEGSAHQQHRKLLMPAFHGERLHQWGADIQAITRRAIAPLRSGQTVVLRPLLKEIALSVILKVLLGTSPTATLTSLYQLLDGFFGDLDSPLSGLAMLFPSLRMDLGAWSPWGKFVRDKAQINQILDAEIDRRKPAGGQSTAEPSDLLTLLLDTTDERSERLSDAEIRDELLMLIFAGYETTTSAIAWALYWTHYSSDAERILAELNSLDQPTDPIQITRASYLSAVCSESLRINPVAIGTFGRRVLQPIEVDGYELPAGTLIHPSIYLAHRREATYPQPHHFKPSRFLNRHYSAYEFLPFGGGVRRCIGDALVQFEMKLILATVLQTITLSLLDYDPVKPVRYGISMAPPTDLKMTVKAKYR